MKKLLGVIVYLFKNTIVIKQVIDLLGQIIDTIKELLDAVRDLKPKTEDDK
jgi:hypothetical protein